MVRWPLKTEARVVGVDDGPYIRGSDRTLIVLTLYRLDGHIDGICPGYVQTDGADSAQRISVYLKESGFDRQARCVISDGACLAGFNVLDMSGLFSMTGIPVVTASDEEPSDERISRALRKFPDGDERLSLIKSHPPRTVELPDGICYVRSEGIPDRYADSLVRGTTLQGRTPEPVRLSHNIARAVHKAMMEAADE